MHNAELTSWNTTVHNTELGPDQPSDPGETELCVVCVSGGRVLTGRGPAWCVHDRERLTEASRAQPPLSLTSDWQTGQLQPLKYSW